MQAGVASASEALIEYYDPEVLRASSSFLGIADARTCYDYLGR